MSDERERPYLCMRCGVRSFNWPNKHECRDKWPETIEEFDAQWKREAENDPNMKAWHEYTTKKYG
jgi:ribosomal protein L37E